VFAMFAMFAMLCRRCRWLWGLFACLAIAGCAADLPRRTLDPPITTLPALLSSPPADIATTTPATTATTTLPSTIPPSTILPPTTIVAVTTEPQATELPTTAAPPPTTAPPTTAAPTTLPLPPLAPDQQPATADEGRALIATVASVDLPADLAGIPPALEQALERVIDGGRPDEAFFDDVGSLAPNGVAVSSYLVCPLAGNQKCAASPADFAVFAAKCGGERAYFFTSMVERADGWAAAGTCVWVPTADEVAFVTQAAANLLLDDLHRRGQTFVHDPLLDGYAAAMAESASTHPQLGSAHDLDQFFAGRDAINAYAWNDHHGYGYFHIIAVSPAAIADGGPAQRYARETVDRYQFDGTAYVGIGSFFARGELVTYYAIVT